MRVILDWVANHTAWDNPLAVQHPDWYERDWKGDLHPTPWWDWSDIIDLDYRKRGLRQYMTEAMAYWVREADIDGYRCDVAGFVPIEFWNNARRELEAIKPGNIFMLAEWESRDLHAHAFDMTYPWTWFDAMHDIARGRKDVNALYVYYSWNESAFPDGGQRMTFVTNHDKNAWDGTEYELFGPAREAAIALSFVGEGTPLIYNGQEAGNRKRLEFFERDSIVWKESDPQGALYRHLIALKKRESALWNAPCGARMVHVPNSANNQVLSFVRQNAESKIFAVFNLSDKSQHIGFKQGLFVGDYQDYFAASARYLGADTQLPLAPWEFKIFVRPTASGTSKP